MGALEKFLAGAVVLIAIYLLLVNPGGTAQVFSGFAQLLSGVFGTLQGRAVSYGGAAGVTVSK